MSATVQEVPYAEMIELALRRFRGRGLDGLEQELRDDLANGIVKANIHLQYYKDIPQRYRDSVSEIDPALLSPEAAQAYLDTDYKSSDSVQIKVNGETIETSNAAIQRTLINFLYAATIEEAYDRAGQRDLLQVSSSKRTV